MRDGSPDPIRKKERDGTKAVSVTTGFILNIGIATIAVSLILFSLQGLFTDLRENSQETQMSVVGEKMIWEMEKVDRMARLHEGSEGEVFVDASEVDIAYTMYIYEDNMTIESPDNSIVLKHDVEEIDSTAVPTRLTGRQRYRIDYGSGEIQSIQTVE